MGGADEPTDYARECGAAWRNKAGAIEWLAVATAQSPAKHRASKFSHWPRLPNDFEQIVLRPLHRKVNFSRFRPDTGAA
jgi:hypothetical protein